MLRDPATVRRLVFACCAALLLPALAGCTRHHPPGVTAARDPVQETVESPEPFVFSGCTVTPLAHFHLTARVLHTCDYWMGRESKLAPRDLALGWGLMSDSAILEDFRIGQMARYYYWSSREMPIPEDEVVSHSANMHIIPADAQVRRALKRIVEGDVVTIDGELVQLAATDGWAWASSTTRTDSGDGACELVFARSIEIR